MYVYGVMATNGGTGGGDAENIYLIAMQDNRIIAHKAI
jgi:hypothetical protein